MECAECKYRKQIPLKRCKHFELGGDKKRKVRQFLNVTLININICYFYFLGTNDPVLSYNIFLLLLRPINKCIL